MHQGNGRAESLAFAAATRAKVLFESIYGFMKGGPSDETGNFRNRCNRIVGKGHTKAGVSRVQNDQE